MREGDVEDTLEESLKYYRMVLSEIRERKERVEQIQAKISELKMISSDSLQRSTPPLASVSELERRSRKRALHRDEGDRLLRKLRSAKEDLARAQERKIEVVAELQSQGVSMTDLVGWEQENEF